MLRTAPTPAQTRPPTRPAPRLRGRRRLPRPIATAAATRTAPSGTGTTAGTASRTAPQAPHDPAVVSRARWSLVTMFGLFGMVATSWMGRLPSIREGLGVSEGRLGLLLVLGAVGSLTGVALVGTVVTRFGSRATLVVGMVGACVGFSLVGAGVALGALPVFCAGVVVVGLTSPATNVPINLEAARVEKLLGKAILPHVHASFSVGAAVGTGLAAVTSTLHVHVSAHIVAVAVLVTAARALLVVPGTALAEQPRAAGGAVTTGPRRRGLGAALAPWTERRTVLIGLVLLAAALSEGSAANWLNLAVVDGFAVREAVGAIAYGSFVVAMVAIRFAGARLIDRFGRVRVLRVSGVAALVGLLAFGLSPNLPTAWIGIVLWGAGAAMASPIGLAAAADEPTKAAARVSVVGSFASIASLTAPPVLGLLADSWGARHALLVITAAMVISLALAGQVRPERVPGLARRTPSEAGVPAPEAQSHVPAEAEVAVVPAGATPDVAAEMAAPEPVWSEPADARERVPAGV